MKTPARHHPSHNPGFTLIELVVVIAILLVLAALILSVSQHLKWSAANTKCLNNLRNLQIANQLYANDHDGNYVPTTSWDGDGVIGVSWLNNTEFLAYLSRLEGISNPQFYWSPFPKGHLCPATQMLGSPSANLIGANYGLNMAFNDALSFPGWGSKYANWQIKAARLQKPGQTVAFADCQNWLLKKDGLLIYKVEEEGPSDSGALAYRHKGRANVVYYDGSAASFTKKEVADPRIMTRFTLE